MEQVKVLAEQPRLRVGLIGAGAGVFSMHQPALQLPELQVVGMSDIVEHPGQERAAAFGAPFYTDYERMVAETQPDFVVVIVPHTIHAQVATTCLGMGINVLTEKPIALEVAEADAMIAAAKATNKKLGVVFQHRFRPEIRAAKAILTAGVLGNIQHVEMTAFWTRAASYYRLGAWRGTWRGEGGGVLLNQAIHHLDLLCFLAGQPDRVYAATPTRRHAIQTEDTAQAHLEWANGALGALHTSTAEGGPSERFQIVGTAGILEIGDQSIRHWRFAQDIDAHIQHAEPFARLEMIEEQVPLDASVQGNHVAVYQQYIAALRTGTPFTDGEQGRMALELADAMILSSQTHTAVTLPIDRAAFSALLSRLQSQA